MSNDEELIRQIDALNVRGRARTEANLRRIYLEGGDDVRTLASRFLMDWRSPRRALSVADDWLREGPTDLVFSWIMWCYYIHGGMKDGYPRFAGLLRSDLSDAQRDNAVDHLSDCLQFANRHPSYREGVALIGQHLQHSSPEVRWTALFSITKVDGKEYRPAVEALTRDRTKSTYGYVSGVARVALRCLDGEQLDIHDEIDKDREP